MKSSPLNGKKVLVVDDEVELRRAIIFDLERRGCEIFEASGGLEAIEIVKKYAVEIVVSDVRMPDGNGVDLLRQIRAIHPEIPIVLLATGFADISEKEAVTLGAYGLIEKPIDRALMLRLLEESQAALKKS